MTKKIVFTNAKPSIEERKRLRTCWCKWIKYSIERLRISFPSTHRVGVECWRFVLCHNDLSSILDEQCWRKHTYFLELWLNSGKGFHWRLALLICPLWERISPELYVVHGVSWRWFSCTEKTNGALIDHWRRSTLTSLKMFFRCGSNFVDHSERELANRFMEEKN